MPSCTVPAAQSKSLFHPRPSTGVPSSIESILYPESYCSLGLSRIHSDFDQEVCLDRFRTPHYSTLPNAAPADRPLDNGRGGWRDQHRIPRRQFSRRLLFPFQRRKGRLARRNSPDLAQRNHPGWSGTRALPRPRPAHGAARRRRHWRRRCDRALRIPPRRRRLEGVVSRRHGIAPLHRGGLALLANFLKEWRRCGNRERGPRRAWNSKISHKFLARSLRRRAG
jgi:hypothetical protein